MKRGRESTEMEYEERIPDLMYMMLIEHLSFNEFIKKAGEKYDVTQRTASNWWADIRNRLKERYTQESEEIIQDQLARYFSLYETALERNNNRVARECLADINRLYGLEKPAKVDVTTAGEPLTIKIVLDK